MELTQPVAVSVSSGQDDEDVELTAEDEEEENELLDGYGTGAEGDMPAIDLVIESITDAIDRLFRLAVKVRDPSTRQIASRVYNYKDIDDTTGINVMDEYAKWDHNHIVELFSQHGEQQQEQQHASEAVGEAAAAIEPQHYLIERLSRANTFRRQQFGYWSRRRRKLQDLKPSAPISLNLATEMVQVNVVTTTGEVANALQAPSRVATSKPYTASMLDPNKINFDDNKSTVSVSEYAPTARGLANETLDWPAPPSKLKGKKHFECPFCFTLCSSGYLERRAWKAHLLRDLRPYVCTYENCVDPDRPYDTRKDWHVHESSSHRRLWRCLEHSELTFQHLTAYEKHLREEHKGEEELQSFQLLKAGESTSGLPDRPCPFCQVEFATAAALQDHIAFHLERVALFALPRSTGVEDESVEGGSWSGQAAGQRNSTRDTNADLDSLGSQGTCSRSAASELIAGYEIDSPIPSSRLEVDALKRLNASDRSSEETYIDAILKRMQEAGPNWKAVLEADPSWKLWKRTSPSDLTNGDEMDLLDSNPVFPYKPPIFPSQFDESSPFAPLKTLCDAFYNDWLPPCERYIRHTPFDPKERNQECMRLTKSILVHVIRKLNKVDLNGDNEAMTIRRALVKHANEVSRRCDAKSKSTFIKPTFSAKIVPGSVLERLQRISNNFYDKWGPLCLQFARRPPDGAEKRSSARRRLTERVFAEIIHIATEIHTSDNREAELIKKKIIFDAQEALKQCGEADALATRHEADTALRRPPVLEYSGLDTEQYYTDLKALEEREQELRNRTLAVLTDWRTGTTDGNAAKAIITRGTRSAASWPEVSSNDLNAIRKRVNLLERRCSQLEEVNERLKKLAAKRKEDTSSMRQFRLWAETAFAHDEGAEFVPLAPRLHSDDIPPDK